MICLDSDMLLTEHPIQEVMWCWIWTAGVCV
jgi:hypothetical protein